MNMPSGFHLTVRVYYEDTDAGGVVYYANYLKFFERARTEWLRGFGFNQQEMVQSRGVIMVVKNTSVEYHAPAKLDDELKVDVMVEHLGRASVQFVQQVWRMTPDAPQLLATGHIKVACLNSTAFRPCPFPDDLLQKLRSLAQR